MHPQENRADATGTFNLPSSGRREKKNHLKAAGNCYLAHQRDATDGEREVGKDAVWAHVFKKIFAGEPMKRNRKFGKSNSCVRWVEGKRKRKSSVFAGYFGRLGVHRAGGVTVTVTKMEVHRLDAGGKRASSNIDTINRVYPRSRNRHEK